MNKQEFIKKLNEDTGLEISKCETINEVLEDHFIVGKNNKEKILNDLCDKLNINVEEADMIYDACMSIVGVSLKDKIKHPFKSQD